MKWVCVALALLCGAAQSAIVVTDDVGRTVRLQQPAQRIVSLAPHLTEQLFEIGAGERIVGASDFSDHPPAARSIPRVARSASVDLERIAALKPDLIVLWGSGFSPGIGEALLRLAAPVFISEPKRLADIASSMQRLGQLTGVPDEQASARFIADIAALHQRYRGRSPVRVFYQVWDAPLMTLSGRHVISEAIELCGGINVFAKLAPLAPQVSFEAVVAADPELIVTAEPGARPTNALSIWQHFPRIKAVESGRLVTLDADRINRHGPRMPQEIEALCQAIDRAREGR